MDSIDVTLADKIAVVGEHANGEQTEQLALKIMRQLKEHVLLQPNSSAPFEECLNALAVCAALLIAQGEYAGHLFSTAVNVNLDIHYKAQSDATQTDKPGPTVH